MNQPKQTLFRLAVLSGLVALRAPASTLLTPITTLADCAVDSARVLSPASCALNFAGSASASLTLSPFVSLTAQAASPPNGGVIHGAAARAVLTYSFEVIGGNPGDIVPVLIATSLSSLGSDPSHGIGFAELSVHTGAAGDSFVAVCSDATCGTTASSFSGTLRTRANSGDTNNALTLQVQASTGDSLLATSASASADPFIFIDPSFPGAALYSIAVSPGVGNAESTEVPEPGTMGLCLGAAALLAGARRRRTAARRVACVAALLWWAVGVGGRAEASVVLQTPPGLNPGDPFRFVFVTEGLRDAISANIADYDSFVNAQAGGATYSGVLIDWLAIGSTDSVDAIDHVGQATAPVFLSDGTLVTSTTTLSGLWSRTLVHEINLDLAANPVQTFVWTGTNPFGSGFGGPLGALTPQVGSTTDSGGAWIDSGRSNSGDFRPLYGISPVLTVPAAAAPEPSTVTMLSAALSVGLAISSTRHRRARQRHGPARQQAASVLSSRAGLSQLLIPICHSPHDNDVRKRQQRSGAGNDIPVGHSARRARRPAT